MPSTSRRHLLAALGTAASFAGCLDGGRLGGGTDTPLGPFEGLSMTAPPRRCPHPEFAYHEITPVPLPTPAAPKSDGAAIRLATAVEAAYLDNWVLQEYDPLPTPTTTPETAAPPPIEYPDVSIDWGAKTVLQRTAEGVVVHLRYRRSVERHGSAPYTVNYYLTDGAVARAQVAGTVAPGPHPTEDGVVLSC